MGRKLTTLQKEILDAHNWYRRIHKTNPLTISDDLMGSAFSWASHLAEINSVEYSDTRREDVGENVIKVAGSAVNGLSITDMWYKEGKDFNYKDPKLTDKSTLFAQVVWKKTTHIGIAYASNKFGSMYIVVRYHPGIQKIDNPFDQIYPPKGGTKKIVEISSLSLVRVREEMFYYHNKLRQAHGVQPYKINPEINIKAQQFSEEILSGKYVESSGTMYGMNVFHSNIVLSIKEICWTWYKDSEHYDYKNHTAKRDIGHFSRMIWESSTTFGCGFSHKDDVFAIVVLYCPPGNVSRLYKLNIKKPKKKAKDLFDDIPDIDDVNML